MENARLHFGAGGNLERAAGTIAPTSAFLTKAHAAFGSLIEHADFPCLGAKAALHSDGYGFAAYAELGSDEATAGLSRDLFTFVASDRVLTNHYATFIAVFETPAALSEGAFEELLWLQLDKLHHADARYFDWDARVSSDPENPHFSFSFAGQAFYIIGMHSRSARMARRFAWPTLVFNPHEQFERLRHDGKWQNMQQTIRDRDLALQGSINPMLSNFGDESEARQYSGRVVPKSWIPDFHPVETDDSKKSGECPFHH